RGSTSTRVTDMAQATAATRGSPKKTAARKSAAKKSAVKESAGKKPAAKATKKVAKGAARKAGRGTVRETDLPELSSPDKVLFPDTRTTKQDVWDDYMAVVSNRRAGIIGGP